MYTPEGRNTVGLMLRATRCTETRLLGAEKVLLPAGAALIVMVFIFATVGNTAGCLRNTAAIDVVGTVVGGTGVQGQASRLETFPEQGDGRGVANLER
jgi:hypothetical protein